MIFKLISQSAAELRREKFFDLDNSDDIVSIFLFFFLTNVGLYSLLTFSREF